MPLMFRYRSLTALLALGLFYVPLWAQTAVYGNVTNLTATPKQNIGHDYIKALAETVNPANGSLSVRIGAPPPVFRHGAPPFYFFV